METLTGLHDFFAEQKYCDVTFVCKDSKTDEWTKLGAHKLALASVSDVFETMFFGDIVQNDGVSNEAEIKIEDINTDTFQSLLGFIYGKEVTFDSGDEALQFLYAADKYNVYEAENLIRNFHFDDVVVQNSIIYYETAEMWSLDLLKSACLEVFQERTVEVLCCPNFLEAKPETVYTIFSVEYHNTTELSLVWALERYIDFNKSKDPEIAEKVRPALKCIRFLTMEKKDVAQITLLTKEQKDKILEDLEGDEELSTEEGEEGELSTEEEEENNVDLNLKDDQGLSSCCDERGIAEIMKMMRAIHPYYMENYCKKCSRYNHSSWNCNTYYTSQVQSVIKEVYIKYKHTFLPAYKPSDVQTLYKAYKSAGNITN